MKKEFVTYWTKEEIKTAPIAQMPVTRGRFFDVREDDFEGRVFIIIPDDITFDQLSSFNGRKTKVTIELMP